MRLVPIRRCKSACSWFVGDRIKNVYFRFRLFMLSWRKSACTWFVGVSNLYFWFLLSMISTNSPVWRSPASRWHIIRWSGLLCFAAQELPQLVTVSDIFQGWRNLLHKIIEAQLRVRFLRSWSLNLWLLNLWLLNLWLLSRLFG